MESNDVIVIGAGPAGAAAACMLARSGAQVRLIERAPFPRPKLCGGCLAKSGYELLREHRLHDIPALTKAPLIEHLDLRSAAQRMHLQVEPYRVVDRSLFDADLVRTAVNAGADFSPETRARITPDYRVHLQSPQRSCVLYPRMIIVADGLKGGSLRDLPEFAWRVDSRARVGTGGILEDLPDGCSSERITMLHASQGYAGLAPLGNGRTLVAAAVDPAWVQRPHEGPVLLALLRSLGLDVPPETRMQITGGAPGLTRSRKKIEADGRVFLIGDSTGYIEPFTGEGMTWALQDASMIAQHAAEVLGGRYTSGTWSALHRRLNRRRKALCQLSTRLLRSPRMTRTVMSITASTPGLNGALTGMVRSMQRQQPPETSIA